MLIDFGLAEGFVSTSSGCSGTAGYIPPETWETERWYPKGPVTNFGYGFGPPKKISQKDGMSQPSKKTMESLILSFLTILSFFFFPCEPFWGYPLCVDALGVPIKATSRTTCSFRRYFQHGHRLLSADDRTGAQRRSHGNLADLRQKRTGPGLQKRNGWKQNQLEELVLRISLFLFLKVTNLCWQKNGRWFWIGQLGVKKSSDSRTRLQVWP